MQQEQLPNSRRLPHPILFGLGAGICLVVLFNVAMVAVREFVDPEILGRDAWLVGVLQLVFMFLPTLLLARLRGGSISETLGFRRAHFSVYIAVILGVIALSPIVQALILIQELYLIPPAIMRKYHELESTANDLYTGLLHTGGGWRILIPLMVGSVIPGLSEETLFRGLMLGSFRERLRPMTAIILTAVVFGALHLQITLIPLIVLAIYLGYVTWSGGSIWPSILGHALFNAFTIIAMNRPGSIEEMSRAHTVGDLTDMLPLAGAGLVIMVGNILWLRMVRTSRRPDTPAVTPPATSFPERFHNDD